MLFLCTGNSARSIIAEALLDHWGRGRFRAYSAGSHPTGQVNPRALAMLTRNHLPTEGLRSKSWDEFATPDALLFISCSPFVTVPHKRSARLAGATMTAHWGIEDPAVVEGSDEEKERAFNRAFRELDARLKIFTSLRLEKLDGLALQRQLDAIGKIRESETEPNPTPQ